MLLLNLLACTRMAIDGQVVDVTGEPIEGAMVTAVGTTCMTQTDAEGMFSLTCNPDTYTLTVGYNGYLSEEWEDYDAGEHQRYELGKVVLVKIPSEKGLLRFDSNSYVPMEQGHIDIKKGGTGLKAYKHYCVEGDDVPVNTLNAGVVPLFDNDHVGWKAWRLDDEGCAYRMAPANKTRWEKTYGTTAEDTKRKVEETKHIVLMTLEPGEYFIADWDQGFFTPNSDRDVGGFSGIYIRAE